MAFNDMSSQLEKGLPISPSFSHSTFKETPTESADTDTTLTERIGFLDRCRFSSRTIEETLILASQIQVLDSRASNQIDKIAMERLRLSAHVEDKGPKT